MVLQHDKRIDHLLVVKNLRPQPATIGQAGEEKRDEHVALGLEALVLGADANTLMDAHAYELDSSGFECPLDVDANRSLSCIGLESIC